VMAECVVDVLNRSRSSSITRSRALSVRPQQGLLGRSWKSVRFGISVRASCSALVLDLCICSRSLSWLARRASSFRFRRDVDHVALGIERRAHSSRTTTARRGSRPHDVRRDHAVLALELRAALVHRGKAARTCSRSSG